MVFPGVAGPGSASGFLFDETKRKKGKFQNTCVLGDEEVSRLVFKKGTRT